MNKLLLTLLLLKNIMIIKENDFVNVHKNIMICKESELKRLMGKYYDLNENCLQQYMKNIMTTMEIIYKSE